MTSKAEFVEGTSTYRPGPKLLSPAVEENGPIGVAFGVRLASWIDADCKGDFAKKFYAFSLFEQRLARALGLGKLGYIEQCKVELDELRAQTPTIEAADLCLLLHSACSRNRKTFKEVSLSLARSLRKNAVCQQVRSAIEMETTDRVGDENRMLRIFQFFVFLQTEFPRQVANSIDDIIEEEPCFLTGLAATFKAAWYYSVANPHGAEVVFEIATEALFRKLDNKQKKLLTLPEMQPRAPVLPQTTTLISLEEELARLEAKHKEDAARIAALKDEVCQKQLSELAASIFGDDWLETDDPTPETLTAKFGAKAGEPLDDDEKKSKIRDLCKLYRKPNERGLKINGRDCVVLFRKATHLLLFHGPGRKGQYISSSVDWPSDLSFE